MHTNINEMLYPDRQAFFAKPALSLRPQTAIKIGPAPMPGAEHKTRIAGYAKGGGGAEAEHGPMKHGVRQMITERSKLDSPGSRELLFRGISQGYLIKEAPQHSACEAVVFWVIMMAVAPPLVNAANAVLELIRSSGGA